MVAYNAPRVTQNINNPDYLACVVYTKTIIYLRVGESDGYSPPLW